MVLHAGHAERSQGVIELYKDEVTDELRKHLPPKRAVDHKIDLVLGRSLQARLHIG
jgi:hypothetical protein